MVPMPTFSDLVARDDDDTCEADPTDAVKPSPSPSSPAQLPSGSPSCKYYGPQPPLTPEGFCSCDGSSTLPLLSVPGTPVPESQSCSYTVQPNPTVTGQLHDPPPTPTTYSDICQVCTRYAGNEANCDWIQNCIPKKGAMTVDLGSSAINIGTLTADELYTSVSSALDHICPTNKPSCKGGDDGKVEIKDIAYVDKDISQENFLYKDGKITVQVHRSKYSADTRGALLRNSAMSIRDSATGKNCFDADYTRYKAKREIDTASIGDRDNNNGDDGANSTLSKRQYTFGNGDWEPTNEKINICSGVEFLQPKYYAPDINVDNADSATDELDIEFSFQKGENSQAARDLLCDFVTAVIDMSTVEIPVLGSSAGAGIGFLCKGDLVQAIKETFPADGS